MNLGYGTMVIICYNADLTFKLDFNTEIMGEHHDQQLFTCKNEDAHDE